ncbi:hypothetical protein ACFYW8_12200 [Streptomyces sp. NPDC002742]|uniref:hypothetical protein n=1 Tax=Streptomyces sp. NPDC002742 TaxID=3364663 RepID=UPI003674AF8C
MPGQGRGQAALRRLQGHVPVLHGGQEDPQPGAGGQRAAVAGHPGPHRPEPSQKPAVSRTAVNIAVGGVWFLAVCGGLLMLTTFIAALTALITQPITLAAVLFGGFIAVQVLTAKGHHTAGTTVNISRAVFRRNHFHG